MPRLASHGLLAVSCLILAPLTAVANPPAGTPAHSVLRTPQSVPPGVVAPQDRGVVRSMLVTVDLGPLAQTPAAGRMPARVAHRIELDLFDRKPLRALLTSASRIGSSQVFQGAVEDEERSSVVLAVSEGQIFGNVKTGELWYQLRHVADGIHAVVEMDASLLPDALDPLLPPMQSVSSSATVHSDAADDGTLVDVLVMYTPRAKAIAGGTSGISNLISTAVAETNTAYQNSGVTKRIRLVHTAETANWTYQGTPVNADDYTITDALALLRGNGDSAMDEAHALRDAWGADAVALIVSRANACGVAYLMRTVDSSFAASAFSVTHWSCATGNYTFGHELGHNMGLAHDRANSSGGAFSYAYGWGDPNGAFRTIMAYTCPGGSCRRVMHFSNPDVTYDGSPTGSPLGTATEAHNALALNNTAFTVANFRAAVVPALTAPRNVRAAAADGNVTVTWTAVTGATLYRIERRVAGGSFVAIGTSGNSPFTDTAAEANQAYLYRVRAETATDASAYSSADLATTFAFSDEPLVAGVTMVKLAHLAELRAAIDGVRLLAGIGAGTYADPAVPGLVVKSVHVTELRAGLDSAATALSLPTSSYTSGATAGAAISGVHFQELRDRLR